jgi:hypothetical protein
MNEDYLWDRSGEPDPEVEHLENVLGKYKYQPTPVSPALQSQLTRRPATWMKFAAIAAAIVIILAGLWIFRVQQRAVAPGEIVSKSEEPPKDETTREEKKQDIQPLPKKSQEQQIVASAPKPRRTFHSKSPLDTVEKVSSEHEADVVAERMPLMNPFVDAETARHIERAQVLLRSFRNTREEGKQIDPEILYEKQQSRGLLSKNILLRRDAEAKGNMPVEELLGGLEPFLLDIANLSDKPSNEEVRSIKQRMQKKEIISALQIYSAPMLSRVF